MSSSSTIVAQGSEANNVAQPTVERADLDNRAGLCYGTLDVRTLGDRSYYGCNDCQYTAWESEVRAQTGFGHPIDWDQVHMLGIAMATGCSVM